jgi:hypothetical protein
VPDATQPLVSCDLPWFFHMIIFSSIFRKPRQASLWNMKIECFAVLEGASRGAPSWVHLV